MCGFAGVFARDGASPVRDDFNPVLQKMGMTLVHRGPDDAGTWFDQPAGIGLAHRRLAVIDLSPRGRQPMQSCCGRYVIAYNGEIYNFLQIRKDLEKEGRSFHGMGDTETLVEAISAWGLKTTLDQCIGMFAFALWDKKERVLFLVRDRVGQKPLYFGWAGKDFVFGSELGAIAAYPHFSGEIDRDALALFLRYSYVPAPYSIYKDVYKLMPGTVLAISRQDLEKRTPVKDLHEKGDVYWSAGAVMESGIRQPFEGSEEEAEQMLSDLLTDAVACRMVSDVPLGALLSGGIDSSTVVSIMQACSSRPIKTFTIGFPHQSFDEAAHARAVAEHLGTDHIELYLEDHDILGVIPDMGTVYDEPFADSSQVPTYLISKLARTRVTVALTGDGGDELFCGYRRYFRGAKIWRANRAVPGFIRRSAAGLLRTMSDTPENRPAKLAVDLAAEEVLSLYINRISACRQPELFLIKGKEAAAAYMETASVLSVPEVTHHLMFLDMINYLTDDILAKVDRAGMSVSLELRNPILDHRVIDLAWRIPLFMKTDGRQGKLILRKILRRYLPQELIDRQKRGFGAPTAKWLAGPLADWAETLLSEDRLKTEGFFDAAFVRKRWTDFLSGKGKYHHVLWNILMFQAWQEIHDCGQLAG